MTKQGLKNRTWPRALTLRLDSQRAWRQGEDAVFLPIVYELPQPKAANRDSIIIQLSARMAAQASLAALPSLPVEFSDRDSDQCAGAIGAVSEASATCPSVQRDIGEDQVVDALSPVPATQLQTDLSGEDKRRNLASLKRRAEARNFRAPENGQKNQAEIDPSPVDPAPTSGGKPRYLSKSVPLLLLSVMALVFFAWMAFR